MAVVVEVEENMASSGYRPDIRAHKGIQEANVKDALRKKDHKKTFDPDYRKIGVLIFGVFMAFIIVYLTLRYFAWI